MTSTKTQSALTSPKWGIVLLQMGGPETLGDIEPFLVSLLSDKRVTGIPFAPLRKLIARRIAKKRVSFISPHYEMIGGGSPILRETENQARALSLHFSKENISVHVAMRYTQPTAADTIRVLTEKNITHIVLLPLYPHYCRATSESSLVDFSEKAKKSGLSIQEIKSYPDLDGYISTLSRSIRSALAKQPDATVVFSAHGIPLRAVKKGDPYPSEIKKTVTALRARLPEKTNAILAYQSRLGPVTWLGPYLDDTVRTLGAKGCKSIVVVPISFVSDHIETLYELDIELKAIAKQSGVSHFNRVPVVGTHPDFISGLASLIQDAMASVKTTSTSLQPSIPVGFSACDLDDPLIGHMKKRK